MFTKLIEPFHWKASPIEIERQQKGVPMSIIVLYKVTRLRQTSNSPQETNQVLYIETQT